MATLVYAPAIRVHIESETQGIVDVSDDIDNWELVRRSNTVSSFNCTLQNAQRKYDGMFRPEDRITVELKRVTWMRVFTGTLNVTPIFSALPRSLPISASCTLKKLQFWPWDPNTNASAQLILKYIDQSQGGTVNSSQGDGGLYKLIGEMLYRVTNWDKKAIHIGAVPNQWFQWAHDLELSIDKANDMAAVLGPAGAPGTTGQVGTLTGKPGQYGGNGLTQSQVDVAGQVYAAAVGQTGLTTQVDQDRAATLALMVAGDESSYTNDSTKVDHTSLGVFQQQDWWGTAAERLNISWATVAFLKGSPGCPGLFSKSDWKTNPSLGAVCQSVQRSAFKDGSNYTAWQATAEALVKSFRAQVSGRITSGLPPAPTPTGTTTTGIAKGTGDALAKVGYDLIMSRPPGSILYSQERGTTACDPHNPAPTRLDCSSLVVWVLFNTTGEVWNAPNTQSQWPACKIKNIPYEIARDIRGCLMYGSGSGSGTFSGSPDHVGISLGNGQHVAAHTDGIPAAQQVDISPLPGGLSLGALANNINYTAAATSEPARAWLQKALGKKTTLSPIKNDSNTFGKIANPGIGGGTGAATTDPFAQLITAYAAVPTPTGDIFGGDRLLINNQPFLPWITNLTNSTMRAFCSAPNGDFMAWFPDYFNVWKTAAIMDIQLIELQDFTADWSDQQIVTHEYVIGAGSPLLDGSSGNLTDGASIGTLSSMIMTQGLVTINYAQVFKTIYGKSSSSEFLRKYLDRFGARPNVESFPNIIKGKQEFYMALWQFCKHWSEQFNATAPLTFMPELYPGMILRIKDYNFQGYVQEVTHRGSYGRDGQFTTEAKIIAAAPCDGSPDGMWGILDLTKGAPQVKPKNRGGKGAKH